MTSPLPVAISMGDAAGIGPEIIAKAFQAEPQLLRGCFVVGDVGLMRRALALLAGVGPALAPIGAPQDVWQVPPRCIPVLQPGPDTPAMPYGAVSAAAGRLAADCVVWGARAALRGEVAALVTAPVHKEALAAAGVPYPGHTELLQAEAALHVGRQVAEMPVRMMLANPELRTVLVSIHVALRAALDAVTFGNVLQTLRITNTALAAVLGHAPRIAVAGLNPHAGEGGLFGREEIETIAPAIVSAQAEGIDAQGPFAPDTVFMRARTGAFDVVVAMYHDQGLPVLKHMGFGRAVNITLGLPIVRTSVDHGTACELAGTGRADPESLIAAIETAVAMATHRERARRPGP